MSKITTKRTSEPGNHGSYVVLRDGLVIGSVLTDETKVWHGYNGTGLVAATGTKREAVRLVAKAAGEAT